MNRRKSIYFFWILFSTLVNPVFCSAQNELNDSLKNKIGFGGWFYKDRETQYFLIGSYSRIIKRENEIALNFYYNDYWSAKEIILGCAFNYSVFKKATIFDLFLAGEINFSRYWWDHPYNGKTVSRYGPFVYLGFIPSVNFLKRFSLSMEIKIGEGYQWGKNDEDNQYGQTRHFLQGRYVKILGGVKLNYKF
ncbi:MAG: hypothetical protein ABI855_16020 [Bacteroidota bacterium]